MLHAGRHAHAHTLTHTLKVCIQNACTCELDKYIVRSEVNAITIDAYMHARTHTYTHTRKVALSHTQSAPKSVQINKNRYPLPTGCPRPRPSVTGASTQWVIFT